MALSACRRDLARDDRGEIAANTVIAAAVLGLFFLVVQAGLWFNAQQVAAGAARHALDAARVESGTAADGEATAEQFLDQTGALHDATVTVDRTADTVTVTVTGTAWSPQPFIHAGVSVTLTAPVERVVG
jgi:Flp pilus assembly protein TadG